MQQKEYEMVIRATIVPSAKSDLIIENTGLSKLNFHGMRFSGRLQVDQEEPTDQYVSGLVTLMCIPNDQITVPTLLTEADLNDSNSFIIGTLTYQMHVTAASLDKQLGYGSVFDFEIAPKTSRSCMRGGKIVGQVTNNLPTADVVLTTLLSTFETF